MSTNSSTTNKLRRSSNISLVESPKKQVKIKFKSYVSVVVLILLVLLFIFMLGRIGPDFFAIIIFLVVVSIPFRLLLRHKLVGLLPKPITDNLLEIDADLDDGAHKTYRLELKVKQIGMYIVIFALCVQSVVLLQNAKKNLAQKPSIYKILGSLVSLVIAGIINLEITSPMGNVSSLTNPKPTKSK